MMGYRRGLLIAACLGLTGCRIQPVTTDRAGSGREAQPPDALELNLEAVDAYFTQASRVDHFGGVVLVARGDEPVFHRAYGLADHELGDSMGVDHIFRIGSLTKPVTAAAVLEAVERGLLTTEQRACRLLSICPDSWRDVTVGQLLSHRSGIEDHFGDLQSVPVRETRAELDRVLATLDSAEPVAFEPGTAYAYSNFNYVLLGVLLESTTGMPWDEVLRQWMFEPLGLPSMGYDDVYEILPGRTRGYGKTESGELQNIDYDDHAAYAAGGLRSTSGDFFRWSRAFFTGAIVVDDLVTAALTPQGDSYGYGWQTREFFGRRVHNHSGGIDGFSTHLAYYPDEDLTVLVFSNVEQDSAILRACDAGGILFEWPTAARVAGGPEPTPRQRCGLEAYPG
jgi:D-alanyl-D-alanine carboxypeptidase